MMHAQPTPNGRSRSGKVGGTQTLRRHGHEYYRVIGAMGGKAKKRSASPTKAPVPTGRFLSGKIAGEATSHRHGREFFVEIGRKGGKARTRSPKPA